MTPQRDTSDLGSSVFDGQPGDESCSQEVLDWKGLCDRCLGNIELAQRVLEKFEQRLPQELAELEQAFGHDDVEQVARIAHRIKGNSANVSAEGLGQAAAKIEYSSRAGCEADMPRHIDRLQSEWQRYRSFTASLAAAVEAGHRT